MLVPSEIAVHPRDVSGEGQRLRVGSCQIEVAQRQGVAGRELVIELQRRFVGAQRIRTADFVEAVGQVGQWDVLVLNRLRRRIEARRRNDASGKGLSRERIVRPAGRLREIARALERRRHHRGVAIVRLFLSQPRVADEEKRLLLRDRPAKRAAVLVAIERVVGRWCARRHPPRSVQLLVAEELERGAVEHVRPGFRDHVHDSRRVASVLCRVAVGQHPELLDRFRVGRRVPRAAETGRVVPSIQLEVDRAHLRPAGTVDRGQLLRPAERVRVVVAGNAAGETQQRIQVAVDEREVQHFVLTHRSRERRGCRVHERRVPRDRHGFADVAELNRGVDPGVASDLEDDARLREILEAGQRDDDHVVPDGEEPQRVLAGLVGGRASRKLCAQVGGGDRGARNHTALGVLDGAQDRSGGRLREGGRRHEHREQEGRHQPPGLEQQRGHCSSFVT